MTDPPGRMRSEHSKGGGPRANETRPHCVVTHPAKNGSNMATVPPHPPAPIPDPVDNGDISGSNQWIGLIKWLLADHRRVAWVLAFLVVILGAGVGTAALLAPHIGDFGGSLGGGVVGGGLGIGGGAVARRRRVRSD